MTQTYKRGEVLDSFWDDFSQPAEGKKGIDWQDLIRRVREKRVIPVISNTLRFESIFSTLVEQSVARGGWENVSGRITAEKVLTRGWARTIQYPLPDTHDLARVAQYNRSNCKDDEQAKVGYLDFLKKTLLRYAQTVMKEDPEVTEGIEKSLDQNFSFLIQELGYPIFPAGQQDPLRILARMTIPIYVTTCQHDFLERALILEGKTPQTQVCLWSGEVQLKPEHQVRKDFVPDPLHPLVYHLFGLEDYPTTLVLSEDDYLDFLARVIQDKDPQRPIIPPSLRSTMAVSSLFLLGYGLYDWDFRVLLRGIINATENHSRFFRLFIQLAPGQQYNIANDQDARSYLESYMKNMNFDVEWSDPNLFLERLWDEWKKES